MAFGLDYVTGPPATAMKDAGVGFVCRYLSVVNNETKIKLLSLNEAKTNAQAGIATVSNYEWYASRATEGTASGVTDAQIARDQHAACGGSTDRPIYFSVDEDVAGEQVADYFRGVASVLGLTRTGAYGSYRVIKYLFDQGLIAWGWQTYAWSGGAWESRAHIQQYQNGMTLAGASVDYNRSLTADFGQWLPGGISMQTYSQQSADFATWFTALDGDHWNCKQTGQTVQFGIKQFFSSLSLDGQTLPIIGLPVTGEQYFTANGKTVVFQGFERAGVFYDPDHGEDSQPGTGSCELCHITNTDFLARYPGLALPAAPGSPPDITALINAINAAADGFAPLLANILREAKKL